MRSMRVDALNATHNNFRFVKERYSRVHQAIATHMSARLAFKALHELGSVPVMALFSSPLHCKHY